LIYNVLMVDLCTILYNNVVKQYHFFHIFVLWKETHNTTSSGKYTRTRLSSTNDLFQYGNSLGYTQFHIVETKETAFADLSQRLEQMKCLNTLMNTPNITQY
jgi:hypothetical protein